MIKFQLLSLWLQRLTAQRQVPALRHSSQAQCPRRRAGKEGTATTQYMGQHLPTPAASVLTWHCPPPSPWLVHTRERPSLPARWSWQQSQVVPPGKAPTRNERTAPPHMGNWSQVHHALTVCYKQLWKHKGMRVVLHLPFSSTADWHPSAPGHKPRQDLSTASAQAV